MVDLSLVVINDNGEEYLPGLVKSIQKQGIHFDSIETILIDNNSEDNSVKLAESLGFKKIFSFANKQIHRGILYNKGNELATNSYVIFAHGDIYFAADFFTVLTNKFNEWQQYDFINFSQYYADSRYYGFDKVGIDIESGSLFYRGFFGETPATVKVFLKCTEACFMVKRQLLNDVPFETGFRESFFEFNILKKITANGGKIGYLDDCSFTHYFLELQEKMRTLAADWNIFEPELKALQQSSLFFAEVEDQFNHQFIFQVYWPTEKGYSEENSVFQNFCGTGPKNLELILPPGIKGPLRIDPVDCPALVELQGVKAFTIDENKNKKELLFEISLEKKFTSLEIGDSVILTNEDGTEGFKFITLDSDPYFFIHADINDLHNNVILEVDIQVKDVLAIESNLIPQKIKKLKAKEQEILSKNSELEIVNKDLCEKLEEINHLYASNLQLEKELSQVLNSFSWRITYPLRIVRNFEIKLRRKLKQLIRGSIAGWHNKKKNINNLKLLYNKINTDEVALVISHSDYNVSLGGTEKYIYEQSNYYKTKGIKTLQIFPGKQYVFWGKESGLYGLNFEGHLIGYYSLIQLEDLLCNIKAQIHEVIVHHLIYWQHQDYIKIHKWAIEAEKELVFFLHDFYSMCPSINMVFSDKKHTTPCVTTDNEAGSLCPNCIHGKSITRWRYSFNELFKDVTKIISPSKFVTDLFLITYPNCSDKTMTWPHQKLIPSRPSTLSTVGDRKLRIAYLGYKSHNKGWVTWEQLYNNPDLQTMYSFYHIGSPENYAANVRAVDYSFKINGMMGAVELLKQLKIDLVVLWSIVPESYSYTLHEAMAAGTYILTSEKSGNIAQVIRNSREEIGKVFNKENELFQFIFDKEEVFKVVNSQRRQYLLEFNPIK